MKNQAIRILLVTGLQEQVENALQAVTMEIDGFTYRAANYHAEFQKEFSAFNPHVVIADCYPSLDANLKLLKHMRSAPEYIPLLMLSSIENEDIALECLKAGADDYILNEQIKRLPFSILNALEKQKWQTMYYEAEEKLKEKKNNYQNVFENSDNAVFLIKNQKFELINLEFEHLFGYGFNEVCLPEFCFPSLAAPECRQEIEDGFRKMTEARNGKQRFEFTALTKDGLKKEIDASVTCTSLNGNTEIQGILRDVTHGKQVEANLRESEKKFQTFFQNHSAVKLIIDPDTGNILEANKSASVFYGWPVEKLQQMNVSEINFLPSSEVYQSMNIRDLQKNTLSELRHINANGEVVDVEIFSSMVSYEEKEVLHLIIHDVSARKKAEQKLQLLNHAVEQNPVAIVITNPEGIIEYVNPEFTSMTGYKLEEVLGKYPRILKSGYQTETFYEKLWNTIAAGTSWEGEFKNRKKNGEEYWQESSISPIFDNDGSISHFVAVMEDVTDKRKMIEDLVLAKEKAEESDRLKSAFLANMSHEIRTPMNGIIGFTDLLKEQKLTGKEKIKYINIIKKSSERMLNTINDLIEISQIESGTMEIEMTDINLNDLMDSFYYQYMPEAMSKDLTLTCHKDFRDSDALIESDGKKLSAIFSNLIKNAIKYTSAGNIGFGYKLKNNMIELFVNDTGIGIESDRQMHVFDRFVQADMSLTKPYEGTGLGLSIAKAYVDMLGGKIWLESEPKVGTKFYFTLPYNGKPFEFLEEIPLDIDSVESEILQNLTVLVAEDDAIGQLYLSELLNGSCKKVIYASDGLEALQMFKESTEKIDLILMDIKMPGMNGYQTTQKIKEINNQVFIIAQTAYALSGDREKAIASGCDYYLAKPFSKAQLLEAVKNYYC